MSRPLFGEIASIPVVDIDASDRLRPLDEAAVEALMVSIEQRNLETPITIRPQGDGWKLVAGGHRLEAIKRLGHETIEAIPRQMTEDEARLAEIDENLIRRELSALDRAIFLFERKAVFDRLNPEVAQPGRRKKDLSQTLRQFGPRFTKQAAERTGFSERAIQLSLELVGKLTPEAREMLRLSPLADNQAQLLELAKAEPAQQVAIARAISEGKAKAPKEARLQLGFDIMAEIDPQERLFQSFLALWARADQRTKARITGQVLTSGKKPKAGAA